MRKIFFILILTAIFVFPAAIKAVAAPAAPELISPAPGDAFLAAGSIPFSWNGVKDISIYYLEVTGDGWVFKNLKQVTSVKAIVDAEMTLVDNGAYLWRVASCVDSVEVPGSFDCGEYSSTRKFSIKAEKLAPPELKAPQYNESFIFNPAVNIRFDWDVVPKAESYKFEIVNCGDLPAGVTCQKDLKAETTEIEISGADFNPDKSYTWLVKACSVALGCQESEQRTIFITGYKTLLTTDKTSVLIGEEFNLTLNVSDAPPDKTLDLNLYGEGGSQTTRKTDGSGKTNFTWTLSRDQIGQYSYQGAAGVWARGELKNFYSNTIDITVVAAELLSSPQFSPKGYPQNGEKDVPLDSLMAIWWDPVSGADEYQWKIDPDHAGMGWINLGQETIIGASVELRPSTEYTLSVKAVRKDPPASSESSIVFTTVGVKEQPGEGAPPGGEPPIGGVVRLENPLKAENLEELLDAIINFIFWVGMALAPVMLIIAGFIYIISAGVPDKTKLAQNIALYTFIGLAVLLFAKGLVAVLISVLGG